MIKKPSISIIGSFVVGISTRLPRMPLPGETLVADLFDYGPGGKGNNVAVAANRLGAHVNLIEKVGEDLFADLAFELYEKEGIDQTHVHQEKGKQTGVGLVYLQENGENTIGLYRGANEYLTPGDVQKAKEDIIKSNVLYVQLEVEDETVLEAVKIGKENGLTVILNPAPARVLSKEILESVNIITPNLGEAFMLLDKPLPDHVTNKQIVTISKELLKLGPETVVITMGSRGALLTQQESEPEFFEKIDVNSIDTVGAGDSFNAGFAVAIAEGKPIREAMHLANINGALATQKIGAINSLPTKKEVELLMRRQL